MRGHVRPARCCVPRRACLAGVGLYVAAVSAGWQRCRAAQQGGRRAVDRPTPPGEARAPCGHARASSSRGVLRRAPRVSRPGGTRSREPSSRGQCLCGLRWLGDGRWAAGGTDASCRRGKERLVLFTAVRAGRRVRTEGRRSDQVCSRSCFRKVTGAGTRKRRTCSSAWTGGRDDAIPREFGLRKFSANRERFSRLGWAFTPAQLFHLCKIGNACFFLTSEILGMPDSTHTHRSPLAT